MKRIIYSCLLLISICISGRVNAQTVNFTMTPGQTFNPATNNILCYSPTGITTVVAGYLPNNPAATTYTWNIASPTGTCNPTFTAVIGGTPTNSFIAMTFPCCGIFTITSIAFNAGNAVVGTVVNTLQIICPTAVNAIVTTAAGTSTTGNGVVCIGQSATITASGAATYTWSNNSTANPLIVTPTTNTCYTFVGTTAQGCTIAPTSANCVSVQAISATVSPATQSMCAGSPVHFTATAAVTTGTNVTGGTSITGYTWFPPFGPSIGTGSIATGPAQGGTYSVIVSHTGAAGTCSYTATAAVVITTNIPVSLSPANPSVCPGAAITLTAISIQTTSATNFTWTTNAGTGNTISAVHNNPHVITLSNILPWTVTVDVNYFGCPGQATTTIGLLSLSPGLVSSAGLSSCPGKSLTLTATGGLTYTFSATPLPPGAGTPTAALTLQNFSTAISTPAGTNFPVQYCVNAFSTGCTGTTCIVVATRILQPQLTASSNSICPGTTFTLYSTTNGTSTAAGANYTFSASYNPNIGSGTSYSITHATPPPITNTSLPQTYTVTADSAGCQGTGTITINKLILTPTLTSASPSICAGTALTLSTTVYAGGNYTFAASIPSLTPPTSSTLVVTPNPTVISLPSGTLITYSVTADSAGCRGSATYSIGILDLGPTLTLSTLPSSGSVCPGTQFTLNASGAVSYTFYAPTIGSFSTGTSATNHGTVTVYPISPTSIGAGVTYTVRGDSLKCTGTNTIVIHEYKLNPGITLSPTIVCSGMPVIVTATNVNSNNIPGAANYTFYTYTPAAPIPTVLPSGPGSFSTTSYPTTPLIYTVRADSAGCTSAVPPPTVAIVIRPDLVLIPSATAASVCPGLSATLSVVAPTTSTTYTYNWSQTTGTGQISPPIAPFTSSIVAYPTANSTYSINVLDQLGCVGNTVITVAIDPSISFSINLASSGSTICAGTSVSLTASSTVALNNNSLGTINYTWTPTSGLTQNTGSSVTASPAVTTIYTVTSDNGYGCVAQNTIDVPVGLYPHVTIASSAPGGVCVGFTATLTAFGANSYTWTGPTFTNSIAQQSISVPGASPSAQYTVVGSNGGTCLTPTFANVPLLPNLTFTPIASSPTTCIESNTPKFSKPVHLVASGASSYAWFPYNPLNMTYSLGPQTDVRPPTTTDYTVIGSTAVCSGSGVVQVIVINQFTMNVVPPLPAMCLGDSLKLSILNIDLQNAVGPASNFTYSWAEALNAPPISISSYFTPTVMVYPQNTTTYTTEVKDARGCISFPKLVTVTVLPVPITAIAIPTINSIATNTVCYVGLNPGAQDVTINLTGNNLNTGLQFGVVPTYTWISPYAPTHISILTPANNNAITVNAPIRFLNNSPVSVYTLVSGYNGVPGCRRIDTVSVRVIDCRPVRSLTFTTAEPNDTICSRNCVTYVNQTDTMAGGPQLYNWTFNGGSPAKSTEQNPTVCYNFPGRYSVILQVSNPYPMINTSGGAPGSTLALGSLNYIKVVDIPNVTIVSPGQLRSDTIVRFGQSVNLNGSGALTYDWSPAYNITSLTKPKVTVNPFKTTQYILTGYNSKHCSSSDTINVIIVENCGEMFVPNAFSPNNDGANDVLYVRGICLQSLTFMVFSRWGEKVFETADQKVGWDGTYKGVEMNTGVFVYRLEGKTYDGKGFSSKGNITLIR